ncbi:hypothetical protein [Pelagicoccus sp. SDUM812002]|uniref:GAP1-N2 domain-containing protein n=1 Tax=Pelagicoccus sp. SDUM812002 TaxID=3041266 RepID=UPI00280E67E9|nr:hypothetical protein [Pelagicoccus sp. SDUM812002]MDQ8184663.1 hypothetical protein [Pelagicoccus sp. SDUM812002]
MSFQYIHTSAKRGLEPGKSGFCCVARDRSLPPDLISELESQSRYTTDSHGASPLILRHRIVTLRSGTYHILSRIHEAGTDYSKRNNHIAHHLAFPQADIPGLPNPAGILLNWRGWREKWVEPPRILEPFEAFDLQDIESYWATQTIPDSFKSVSPNGNLISRVFRVSIPQERLLIEHLRRCINELPTSYRWQHSFTSCLLPTDQPQDYAWAGHLPSLSLPYDLPTYNLPLKASAAIPVTPKNAPNPRRQQPAPEPPPPEDTSSDPKTPQRKFAAPRVEIPEEYDHRKRKRPKRHFGQREFTRTINISIAGVALICIALVVYFVQTHRAKSLGQSQTLSSNDAERALQARHDVWQRFADSGYPRSELENARATANFLAKAGEDTPLQIITFLDRLIARTAADNAGGIIVPKNLIQLEGQAHILPLSPISYPELNRLALLPIPVAQQLDFPHLDQKLAPLSAMPLASFSVEALSDSLGSYLLLANGRLDAIPAATRQAIESYFTQLEEIQDNHQFSPILTLPQAFGLSHQSSYIAVDSRRLLIPSTPMSLAQYLRELFLGAVERSDDQAFLSSVFQDALDKLLTETRSSPAETATMINEALNLLDLQSRTSQDPLRKIQLQWQYTFTHPDLMEQTIIGYNLDALQAAKLRLAETRSQFSQTELSLYLASQKRAEKAAQLITTAKEAISGKDWIVISKQSNKAPLSLP